MIISIDALLILFIVALWHCRNYTPSMRIFFSFNMRKHLLVNDMCLLLEYQVAFEAIKGSGNESDIAIDSIMMNECGEY
jgi:hypothetical protein